MQIDTNSLNTLMLAQIHSQSAATPEAIARATAIATQESARLDRVLLRLGLVEENELLPMLCTAINLPFLSLNDPVDLDLLTAKTLTTPYLSSQLLAPLKLPNGDIAIAMADPANFELRTEISFHLGYPVTFMGAATATIRKLLARLDLPDDVIEQQRAVRVQKDTETLRRTEADGPVIKFVQEKLADAVVAGASDIHVESTEDGYSLRFRINGVLVPQRVDPTLNPASVLARLKVMAQVNVAERRLPQDGRMEAMIAGRKIDFRFSSLPTQWGESIVCRVLDPKALRLGWDRLGFSPDLIARVLRILERPSGLFLVTGPVGSGKTTTLYTAISHLNTVGRKIVTVEDPVEYNLPGIQQVQVHDEIGLSFPHVLRGILRHDPNVILVGEIRDEATAEIAVRAAQVGRLVLSTLHTNSASAAVSRLVDLGVPEFLLRDVLRGVLGQELLVTPCLGCGGAGCLGCGGTGVGERRLRAELVEG